ncbi:MAG: hypothetical protein WDW38_002363 [Sanguina aurantia]
MSSSAPQHSLGPEQALDRTRSSTVQGRGMTSPGEQPAQLWDAQAMYNHLQLQHRQQQQQAQQPQQVQHQQQKYLQQDTNDARFPGMAIDPSSGAMVGTTDNGAATQPENHSLMQQQHSAAPVVRSRPQVDLQEKERLAVAASSGLYAPYSFPAPQKRVSSAIFSPDLLNSPYFSVDEGMSSGSGSILAFPAMQPAMMDPAAAAAALQEGLMSGIDDYHLLLLAQAAGLMDESANLLPAYGGQGGGRQGSTLPTIHSGTGMAQEPQSAAAGNGQFNPQETLAAFLHQQQTAAGNKPPASDPCWFGVDWNDQTPNTNNNRARTASSPNAPLNLHTLANPGGSANYPSGLHTLNNQAAWSQPNNAGHSTAGPLNSNDSSCRNDATIEGLSAEIAALLTLPGTSLSQINSLQALLMGNNPGSMGAAGNVQAARQQPFAPKASSGNQNSSNWLRGGDDSAGGGYSLDGAQGYTGASVPTDPWLHPLSLSACGGRGNTGLRRTSMDDPAPGSPGPASRNAGVNNSPWSGTLAGLNGDTFASGIGSPSVPGRQHSLYKTELCRSWDESGSCRYGSKCQFAHGREELRPVQRHGKPKPEGCRAFAMTGSCPYGSRCRFVHNPAPSMLSRPQPRANSLDTGSKVVQQQMMTDNSAAQTFRRSLDALIGRHTQQQSDYNAHILQSLRNNDTSFPSALLGPGSLLAPLPSDSGGGMQMQPSGLPPVAPQRPSNHNTNHNPDMLSSHDTPSWQHSLVAAMGGLQRGNSNSLGNSNSMGNSMASGNNVGSSRQSLDSGSSNFGSSRLSFESGMGNTFGSRRMALDAGEQPAQFRGPSLATVMDEPVTSLFSADVHAGAISAERLPSHQ